MAMVTVTDLETGITTQEEFLKTAYSKLSDDDQFEFSVLENGILILAYGGMDPETGEQPEYVEFPKAAAQMLLEVLQHPESLAVLAQEAPVAAVS